MRNNRLTATLVAIPLAAVACGTAISSTTDSGAPAKVVSGSPQTARSYAAVLLAKVNLPAGAKASEHAPSKALEHLPEYPSLAKTPTVVTRFWTVNEPASAVYAWLKVHGPGISLLDTGGAPSTQPAGLTTQHLAYQQRPLPASIGAAYLYLTVVGTGPTSSAIAASALTIAQTPRPPAETVSDVNKAVVGWSLALGGTPVVKTLTGAAATKLAADFNALKVDVNGTVACPMMPTRYGDITVTFSGQGHTWKVDIPACPSISVTRDGQKLPPLAFGKAFLADVRGYTGQLPQSGPPQAGGGVIPLVQPPSGH